MNILLAISETPPMHSGMARIAGRLREGFSAAGHSVDLLSVEDTGRVSLGELRLTGLMPRWRSLRSRFAGADVVSVFGPAPTFSDALLLLAPHRRGAPKLVYTHAFEIDLPWLSPACELYNWFHRRLARRADQIVVATPDYASLFGSAADRVSVIPWGIDSTTPPAANKGRPFTVLFAGQLRRYKGVPTLLRAARYAPEGRILIAGEGPQRVQLERQAASLGAHNVRFLGAVSDGELAALYCEAHAVVLPSVSRMEAFGMTLLEGMSAGAVPVASALPGVTEVVGDAGLTFPAGDAVALGRILAMLCEDAGEWRERSHRARERSRQFSWQRTVAGYLQLYEALLEPRTVCSLSADRADELQPALKSRP